MTTKILHRSYFQNDFIFVRPAVSTEYIENGDPEGQPTYRSYYPAHGPLHETVLEIIRSFDLQLAFEDLDRDATYVVEALQKRLGDVKLRANFQIQVLSGLFYRNKGAYVVGKIINGLDRKSTRLNSSHLRASRMPSSA